MPRNRPESELKAAKRRRQEAFLAAFETAGTISAAAKAARMHRRLHHKWMQTDEAYVERFLMSQEIANEALENEARRRAVEGWKEPVFYEGEHVGDKPKYSDALLKTLLEGNLPQKYKQRYEHSGDPQNPLQMNFDLGALSDEELRSLNKIIDASEGE